MPVALSLKTYGKPKTYEAKRKLLSVPACEASLAFDALFEKNRSLCNVSQKNENTQRSTRNTRQKKNIVKELPNQPTTLNDSFNIKINTTFDELFAGPKYNSVRLTDHFSKVISDGSYDTTNSLSKKSNSPKNRNNKSLEKTNNDKEIKKKIGGKIMKKKRNTKKKIVNSFISTVNNNDKRGEKKKKEVTNQKKLEKTTLTPRRNPTVLLKSLPLDKYHNSTIIPGTPEVSQIFKKRKLQICDRVEYFTSPKSEEIINVDFYKFESFAQIHSHISISDDSNNDCLRKRKTRQNKSEINERITFRPGKDYRRTLVLLKQNREFLLNSTLEESPTKGKKWKKSIYEVLADKNYQNHVEAKRCTLYNVQTRPSYRQSIKIVKLKEKLATANRKKSGYVPTVPDDTVLEDFSKLSLVVDEERDETAKDIVLKYCKQTEPFLFDECYSERSLQKCRKIGEGVYGEVFMCKTLKGQCSVMKIIPIEGAQLVNGEHQKKYEEIISEIIISTELSNLRNNDKYRCDGFAEVLNVCLVQGKYPQHLIDLWDLYDEDRGSENDSPILFNDDQLYIVLELANGGQDLEAYNFGNAETSYSLFIQIACTMAVAEAALQFEHRDLHWGNVLISQTDKPTSTFIINGREFEIPIKGIKLTIIDFTLSRMTVENCCIYNDLAMDPDLFTATGDYQFEVYRLMQKRLNDDWQNYEPYTNVLWLDYILDKMIGHLRYIRTNSKTHKNHIRKLSHIKKKVLNYNNVNELINSDVFSNVFL